MSKSFVATDPVSHQGENTWFTPREFINALGPFNLDPCTVTYRPFDTAAFHYEFDAGSNGLEMPWDGDVWLNPPYGKEINPFIDKFIDYKRGCALIFARMGAPYCQALASAGATFCFLRKRVAFIDKTGVKRSNAGADSCIVFFDEKYAARLANNFECVFMEAI